MAVKITHGDPANPDVNIVARIETTDTHMRLIPLEGPAVYILRSEVLGIEDAPAAEPPVNRVLDLMARMPGTTEERAKYLHLCRHANNLAAFFLDAAQDNEPTAREHHAPSLQRAAHEIYNWIESRILDL